MSGVGGEGQDQRKKDIKEATEFFGRGAMDGNN